MSGELLRFYIQPSWDATAYVAYVYPPSNWAAMNHIEQLEFLRDEARTWMEQQIEFGADAIDPSKHRGSWETGGISSEPEDWYDSAPEVPHVGA